MIGIVSYGTYIPIYRLARAELSRAWGGGSGAGERAVANFDEDSLTMGVAAAIECLNNTDRSSIDSVYFATTTSPFQEKQGSTVIATATNLRREIFTSDSGESTRCGTSAMKTAIDAAKAGSSKRSLLIASDSRLGAPKSDEERNFGDGAAALIIGDSNVAVEIVETYAISDEIYDFWRMRNDESVQVSEDRFVHAESYIHNMTEAIAGILKKSGLSVNDFAKVVFFAPDERRHRELAKALKLEQGQIQDPMFDTVGNTGCAYGLMMLVAALEDAKAGDKILFANFGSGADAYIFQATDQIKKGAGINGTQHQLKAKMSLPSYETYIRFRELMPIGSQKRPDIVSSTTQLWRDREWILGANANKCRKCGYMHFPPHRVCLGCQAKDDYDNIPISGWKGSLFTYSKDNLALNPDPPLILSIANFEGKEGKFRFYSRMTDRDPDKVEIGTPLQLTFRKMHDGGGYPNYFWKIMPIR